MKSSLPSALRRALSTLLASAMLASNLLSGVSVASAVGGAPPPGSDATTSPPGASAASSPTVVGEIVASRTADSSTFALSDGSRCADIYTQPVHYQDAAGRWDDIDPTLVPTGVFGQERAKATALTETFGSDQATGPPVTVSGGDWSLGMDLIGGEQSQPFALGDHAIYPLAQTDTQLAYESRRDGVKDTLVLASPNAPDTFTFLVSLKNLALYTEPGSGAFALYDTRSGQPAGRVEPLSVFDSADKTGGQPATCEAASMTVATAPGGVYVTYHVPRAWLDDTRRVYPVLVDPAVTFAGPSDTRNDLYVAKGDSAYHYGDNHLDASLFAAGDLRRALVNFNLPGLTRGSTINSAKLQMYLWKNSSAGDFNTLCQPVTGSWGYTATWANTFGNGSVGIGTGGTYETIAGGPDHYAAWYMTNVVQKWVNGTLPNNGFVLYANSETAVCQHSFWSAEYTTYTSRQPHLIVDYTLPSVTVDPMPATVHVGDTVSVTVHSQSRVVSNVQAKIDGRLPSGATTTTAYFAFTTLPPGAGWVSAPVEGGYISYAKTPSVVASPQPGIVPDLSACSTKASADGRDVTFVYRIGAGHGDIQNNRVSTVDPDWTTSWQDQAQAYNVLTNVVTPSVVTSASAVWFDEVAGNDDTATAGRGSVALSWPEAGAAAGYDIYLFDGNAFQRAGTTTGTTWSTSGMRLYPSDSAIASLSTNFAASPFTLGSLDLRDDPRPLYAKTAGTSWDNVPAYALKVVPHNSAGAPSLSECPTITVALAGRTKHIADEPRHTSSSLGKVGVDDAAIRVDRGDIVLSATDLTIPGAGPDVTVSRAYRSSSTTASLSSPGWRFSFERSVSANATSATYLDEVGDAHLFRRLGGSWVAPHGDADVLTGDAYSGFTLAHKDRSAASFDASGRLTSEADEFGNTVRFEWSADGSQLVIRTPRDLPLLHERRITVAMTSGKVVRATAHVSDGDADRVVTYDPQAAALTVTTLPGTDSQRTSSYRYDCSGRIRSVALPGFVPSAGGEAVWSIGYDPTSSAITVANETGAATPRAPKTASCDLPAGTATIVSASGTSTLAFDPTGEQVSSTEENTSAATVDRYDAQGDVIAETSPSGRTKTSVYDGRGNVLAETDEGGATTTYQYVGDLCTNETDAHGSVTSRSFDAMTNALLREEKTLNGDGEKSCTEYGYNADGTQAWQRKAVNSALTAGTDYSDYADCGQAQTTVNKSVEVAQGAFKDLVSHSYRDGFGDSKSAVDAAGVTTAVNDLDAAGRITEATDANGTVAHTRFGLLGDEVKSWRSNPTTTTIADWRETVVNGASNPITEVTKASDGTTVSTTAHSYDAAGREIKADDSSVPGAAVTRYDAQGNIAQTWDEGADTSIAAASTRTSFNADGEEASATAPGSVSASVMTSYTAGGQVASESGADGATTDYGYNEAGDLATETVQTDVGAADMAFDSDLDGRPVDEVDSGGTTETTRYDLDGNEISSALGVQTASTTRVNNLGWPLVSADFDGVVTRTSYDMDGRTVAQDVGGLLITTQYDGDGRLTRQVNANGTVVTHTYDCFGDEIASAETSGASALRSTSTSYDSARRVVYESVLALDGSMSTVRSYAYDTEGRATLTEFRRGGDVALATAADGAGRVRSLVGVLGGCAVDWSVNATDLAGRTTSLDSSSLPLPNTAAWTQAGQPLQSRLGSATTDYAYSNESGKKTRDSHHFAMGGRSEVSDYAYDQTGRLTASTTNGVTTAYRYDTATGALISRASTGAALISYSYEASGTGRLVSAGPCIYRSDSVGHRIAAGSSSNPLETRYSWSGDTMTGIVSELGSASYTYDGQGQRVRSVVTSAGLITDIDYDYDGTRLLGLTAARSDGATWTIDYVYNDSGLLMGGVYRSGSSAVPFRVETTSRGDVRELLDAGGASFALYSYDAFGVPAQTAVSATPRSVTATLAAQIAQRQPLRFASYAYDAESGLYYCSARYYDPSAAAFISKDPDQSDGEQSPYQYCSGDPVGNVDPTGRDVWGYGTSGDLFYRNLKGGEFVIVRYAVSRIGGRYVFGAKAKSGKEWQKGPLDCSGLTAAAYRLAHRVDKNVWPTLPDGSVNQHDNTKSLGFKLKASRLKIGDLGFLHKGGKNNGTVHHVAIYIGRGWVVEARGKKWGVVKTYITAFNKRGADWHRARK